MAKKVTSSRTSEGPERKGDTGAAVAERSTDAGKKSASSRPNAKTTGRGIEKPVKKARPKPSAKATSRSTDAEFQHRANMKSSKSKSSIASKVVEGLKATATGALGAVSLAAQALTSE